MLGVRLVADPGGSALIRKSPVTDFASGSILEVPPYCRAIVDINGKLFYFKPGRYELETGLSPLFAGVQNFASHGIPLITANVYFYNTDRFSNVSFGTNEVVITDLETQFPLRIAGHGIMRIRIKDGPTLFRLLHGNGVIYTQEMLADFLTPEISPTIQQALAEKCRTRNYLEVASCLQELTVDITNAIEHKLSEYGLELESARLVSISPREEDLELRNKFIRDLQTGKMPTTILLDEITRIYGGDVTQAMMYKIYMNMASNPGSGNNFATLPLMMAMGQDMMDQYMPQLQRNTVNRTNGNQTGTTPQPTSRRSNAHLPRVVSSGTRAGKKRCGQCGAEVDSSTTFCPFCNNALF